MAARVCVCLVSVNMIGSFLDTPLIPTERLTLTKLTLATNEKRYALLGSGPNAGMIGVMGKLLGFLPHLATRTCFRQYRG